MPAIATVLHVVEIGVLMVAFGCGMAAAITIGLTSSQMLMCVLKASVSLVDATHFLVTGSNPSRCQFCLVTQVVAILLSLVFILYRLQVLCRGKCEIQLFGRFIVIIIFGLMAFFVFVESCLVSAGLNAFCGNLLALKGETCAEFQSVQWDPGNGAHFYDFLKAAEAASWISLLLWLTLVALSLVSCLNIKRRNKAARASHNVAAAAVVT